MLRSIVRIALVTALCFAVLALIVWGYEQWAESKVDAGDERGAARIQARWDEADRKRAVAAVDAERSRAAETQRRLNKIKENDDVQAARMVRVAADRDAARAAADSLQLTASTYLAAAGCAGRSGDSAIACIGEAVTRVLNVFGSCGRAVEQLAAAVDDARTRGQRCEQDYDALVLRPATPLPAAAGQPPDPGTPRSSP